ncbi:FAD-binding oxidoreductase [Streptomyces sp. NBC_01142]|uniref:NAD(P)/FAD-dependent oxidoreductase n=1 Tax=Streptomyces sp. NBC_01142 TaxID=2975865 RepID=UPI0022586F5B|nr:FAD-binding oxidoreductase [Streptomyces sp. NBC_01142]MCX4825020.1 FAD-binding oxidoreductase [Streptomyces sp. NBC_01142]
MVHSAPSSESAPLLGPLAGPLPGSLAGPLPGSLPGPLPASAEVVVIGGGVVGASVAFHLAEAGVGNVLVLERDEPASGSSGKPIGGIRAQFSDPLNIGLGQRSLEAWRAFTTRPGADIGIESVGYLFLLGSDEEVATFQQAVDVQNDLGVRSRIITPREAHALCPYLDPRSVVAAAYSPDDGYALPKAAVHGYLRAAQRHGATLRTHCAVTGIDTDGGQVRAVHTTAGTVRTKTVVCAAGPWSAAVGAMAGVELPVTPLRRQIALTGPLNPAPPRIPFTLDFDSTLYFHNDSAGGLVLGLSDPRQEPGFGREFSREWLEPFRAAAERRAPALAGLKTVGGWAGLYEMTPDRNALIGRAREVVGFLYATGFSGHGFLQAPAVGEIVRDLCLDRTPFIDVGPLSASRFEGHAAAVRPEAHII